MNFTIEFINPTLPKRSEENDAHSNLVSDLDEFQFRKHTTAPPHPTLSFLLD